MALLPRRERVAAQVEAVLQLLLCQSEALALCADFIGLEEAELAVSFLGDAGDCRVGQPLSAAFAKFLITVQFVF